MKELAVDGKNRFKFLSAAEKLKELNIDVIHRVGGIDAEPSNNSSYFHESLRSWRDTNCSRDFKDFYKETNRLVVTLPMLLHHREKVVKSLCKYMSKSESLALDALFSLTTMLARDLRSEVYPMFPDLLKSIMVHLKEPMKTDPAVLENAFMTILYLFKFLGKYLVQDLESVLDLFLPLLDASRSKHHKSNYFQVVRRFSAECLAYLIRKLKDKVATKKILDYIVAKHKVCCCSEDGSDLDLTESLAFIVFETVKGVRGQLHSRAPEVLGILMESITFPDSYPILRNAMVLIMKHCDRSSCAILSDLMLGLPPSKELFCILAIHISSEKSLKVHDVPQVFRFLSNIWTEFPQVAPLMGLLLAHQDLKTVFTDPGCLSGIFGDISGTFSMISTCHAVNPSNPTLAQDVIPKFLQSIDPSLVESNLDQIVKLATKLIEMGLISDRSAVSFPKFATFFSNQIMGKKMLDPTAVKLLPYFDLENKRSKIIVQMLESDDDSIENDLLNSMLKCIIHHDDSEKAVCRAINAITRDCPVSLLETIYSYIKEYSGTLMIPETSVKTTLIQRLVSASSRERLVSLKLICILFFRESKMIQLAIKAESIQTSLHTIKQQLVPIGEMERMILAKKGLDPEILGVVMSHLIGMLSINFTPLWKHIYQLIGTIASINYPVAWESLKVELEKRQEKISAPMEIDLESCDSTSPLTSFYDLKLQVRDWDVENFAHILDGISLEPKEDERKEEWEDAERIFRILSIFREKPEIAERNSKYLLPMFFLSFGEFELEEDSLADETSSIIIGNRRKYLYLFLEIFKQFKNPRAISGSAKLLEVYFSLLCQGETRLSSLAVSCILSFRDRSLVPYKDLFEEILDDHKFRDALSNLISGDGVKISEEDTFPVYQVIIRILYGKMIHRHGKNGARQNMSARRKAIMTFISGLDDQYIGFFISLLIPKSADPMRKKVGFINVLGDVFKYLNRKSSPYVSQLAHEILEIGKLCYEKQNEEDKDLSEQNQRKLLRHGCVARFCDLIDQELLPLESSIISALNEVIVIPRFSRFMSENMANASVLLDFFVSVSKSPMYLDLLFTKFCDSDGTPAIAYVSRLLHSDSQVCVAAISKAMIVFEEIVVLANSDLSLFQLVQNHFSKHFELIMNCFENFLQVNMKAVESAGPNWARRSIAILAFLSPLSNSDVCAARRMMGLFIPYLKKIKDRAEEATALNVLQIICDFISKCPNIDEDLQYYSAIMPLFSVSANTRIRNQIVQVLGLYGKENVAYEICRDLNSFSEKRINEPDFETRLSAFLRFNDSIGDLKKHQLMPIIHNLLFFIKEVEEMALRNHASMCLAKFVETVSEENITLVHQTIFASIKKGLASISNDIIRHEYLNLLYKMVSRYPDHFADLVPLLANGDEEANIFLNLHHLQYHRRQRAIRRLGELLQLGQMKGSTMNGLIAPLVSHFIFESDKIADHAIINEAINLLKPLGQCLPWGPYHNFLRRIFTALDKKPELEKVCVRSLVSLLEGFSFKISHISDSTVTANDDASRIYDTVVGNILPRLYGLLIVKTKDEEVTFRIPVALAITELLVRLNEKTLKLSIPKLFMDLCALLRSRMQDVRDSVRETFVKIIACLGPKYFGFLVQQMSDMLTRGYQKHILGFSVHHLLKGLAQNWSVGDIDYCIEDVMDVLVEDLFGSTSKEKDIEENTGKIKEERSKKGFDSLEILSEIVGFQSLVDEVLFPFKSVLEETSSKNVVKDVALALKRITIGFGRQSVAGVSEKSLLTLIHGLVKEELPGIFDALNPTLSSKQAKFNAAKDPKERDTFNENFKVHVKAKDLIESPMDRRTQLFKANSHLLVSFGLMLLLSGCKAKRFQSSDDSLLDSIICICAKISCESKHPQVTVLSLQVLSHALLIPGLTQTQALLPEFMDDLFRLIGKIRNTGSDITQKAFKILTLVLKEARFATVYQMNDKQLCLLLELIKPDLEEPERQSTTFSLIKAIVAKTLVVPELYDLMQTISELLVTSQTETVRLLSRQVLSQFLSLYPLGRKRIEQHMNFMIHNLSYTFESGRQSVMEFWFILLDKFKWDYVSEYVQVLVMALSMRLVNDDSSKCRQVASKLLQTIFKACPSDQRKTLFMPMLEQWLASEKEDTKRLALQLYGLYYEALPPTFEQVSPFIVKLNNLAESMDSHCAWEYSYFYLVCLTKILGAVKQSQSEADYLSCLGLISWDKLEAQLSHPHQWVRKVLSSLFVSLFEMEEKAEAVLSEEVIVRLTTVWTMMLRSENLTEDLADSIIRCFYYISKKLYVTTSNVDEIMEDPEPEPEQDLDQDPEDEDEDEDETNINDSKPSNEDIPFSKRLRWLLRKLSFQARMDDSMDHLVERKYVLRYFLSLTKFMTPEGLSLYLSHILGLLYRISESMNRRKESEAFGGTSNAAVEENPLWQEVNSLGQVVFEKIRDFVGPTLFLQKFQDVRDKVERIRIERRQKRKLQAVMDPEANAARKIKRNELKRASRKRKTEEYSRKKLKFGKRKP